MQRGEFIATIAIIVTVAVILWRRGAGWRRILAGSLIAWLGSAVIIVAWEIVILLVLKIPARPEPAVQRRTTIVSEIPRGKTPPSLRPTRTPRPTHTPTVPQILFPIGTEVLVNNVTRSAPLRAKPKLTSRIMESLRAGDVLVITGDFVLVVEPFGSRKQVYWPVRNPESGKTGYFWEGYIDKDVMAGTGD